MNERDEKDARIKELEVSLAGARFNQKYQLWEKDRSAARADLLEIENRKLRAEIAELNRRFAGGDDR